MTNSTIFNEGTHSVLINDIELGYHNDRQILKILFVNNYGYIRHKISITDKTDIIFKILFDVVGLKRSNDFDKLVGRKLNILVNLETYIDTNGEKRTAMVVKKFFKKNEDQLVRERKYNRKSYFEDDSIDSFADIFGTSVNDIANSMGKDSSEISRNDIMENCGY